MDRSNRLRTLKKLRAVEGLIGVLLCASAAALVSLVFHSSPIKFVLPLVFLGLITVVALRFGIAAGVVGSLASAFIFAVFLFMPNGSLQVHNGAAKSSLGWLLMGGITLSFLFAPQKKS